MAPKNVPHSQSVCESEQLGAPTVAVVVVVAVASAADVVVWQWRQQQQSLVSERAAEWSACVRKFVKGSRREKVPDCRCRCRRRRLPKNNAQHRLL